MKFFVALSIFLFVWNHSWTVYAGAIYVAVDDDREEWIGVIDSRSYHLRILGSTDGISFEGLAYDSKNRTLYGSGVPTSDLRADYGLYRIDTGDATLSLVGSIGAPGVAALTYDPIADVLYGNSSSTGLMTIDRSSGVGQPVGSVQQGASSLGFDPLQQQLVATNIVPGDLMEIDETDGTRSTISPGIPWNVFAMGYDSTHDTMYGIADSTLLEIQPQTGEIMAVATLPTYDYSAMAIVPESSFGLVALFGAAVRLRRRIRLPAR